MRTSLNQICQHSPCKSGWEKLLRYLGKTQADDEPLLISTIVKSNGLDDALWCLRAVNGHDKEIRLYAIWCARQVQHLLTDKRLLNALVVAESYANGEATEGQLAAVWDAARAAAREAAEAAAEAASRAAEDAEDDAIWAAEAAAAAARAAARAASRAAVWDAARDAALAAVWDAARDSQADELLRVCSEIEAKLKEKNT